MLLDSDFEISLFYPSRLQQSGTTKRSKEELNKGSQNLSASWQQKNGHHPVS